MKTMYIKADSRNRVSLKKIAKKLAPIYRAYTQENKIILEPVEEIPAEEAWLFKPENKQILDHIRKSLMQDATIDFKTLKKHIASK